MLTFFGDALNWLAAGVLFPLMLLPLAALLFNANRKSSAITTSILWLAVVAAIVGAGILFAYLAPRMGVGAVLPKLVFFGPLVLLLALLTATLGGPNSAIQKFSPIFEAITKTAGRMVMWLVLLMALVQFAVVIMRYVFGVNFIFMQESVTYMHGAVFLLAGGYALLTDDHVRVDIFYRGASERRKALIDFLGTYLFLVPVCLLILWTGSDYVAQSWSVLEGSTEQSGIQGVYLLKTLIPLFAVLLLLAGFSIAARAGGTLRGEA